MSENNAYNELMVKLEVLVNAMLSLGFTTNDIMTLVKATSIKYFIIMKNVTIEAENDEDSNKET